MFEVPYKCFLIKIINIKNYKAEKCVNSSENYNFTLKSMLFFCGANS